MSDASPYHHGALRPALMRAAIETIEIEGVEAVSLRALARKLAVSHAAPARHFPSRADLLCAVALEGVETLIDTVTRASETAARPRDRLREMAKASLQWAVENPAHHQALRSPEVIRHRDPRLEQRLTEMIALQRDLAAAAQDEGWRATEPTEMAVMEIAALTAGWAIVATDPTYGLALGQRAAHGAGKAAIDRFFS